MRDTPTQINITLQTELLPLQTTQGNFQIRNLVDATQVRIVTVSIDQLPGVAELPLLELQPIFNEEQTRYIFSLRNPTEMSFDWELRSPDWIDISLSSGTLPAESTTKTDAEIQFTDLPPQTHISTWTDLIQYFLWMSSRSSSA